MTPPADLESGRMWHRYGGDHDCWAAGCDLRSASEAIDVERLAFALRVSVPQVAIGGFLGRKTPEDLAVDIVRAYEETESGH